MGLYERDNRFRHIRSLRFNQLGINGYCDALGSSLIAECHITAGKIGETFLSVQRNGVVDIVPYFVFDQMGAKIVPNRSWNTDDVLIEDVPRRSCGTSGHKNRKRRSFQ